MKKLHYKANTDIGVQFYESVFRDYGDNYVLKFRLQISWCI